MLPLLLFMSWGLVSFVLASAVRVCAVGVEGLGSLCWGSEADADADSCSLDDSPGAVPMPASLPPPPPAADDAADDAELDRVRRAPLGCVARNIIQFLEPTPIDFFRRHKQKKTSAGGFHRQIMAAVQYLVGLARCAVYERANE